MNKHTIIVIITSIVIVGTLGYSALNIYTANQMQFRGAEEGQFRYFELINNGKIAFCNPLPFSASVNEVNIVMVFEGKNKGTVSIQGFDLAPNSATTVQGKYSTETISDLQESNYLTMHFDGMFRDDAPIRIDARKMEIVSEIRTQIVGIPYAVTTQYSGLEFWEMMDSKNGEYSC